MDIMIKRIMLFLVARCVFYSVLTCSLFDNKFLYVEILENCLSFEDYKRLKQKTVE